MSHPESQCFDHTHTRSEMSISHIDDQSLEYEADEVWEEGAYDESEWYEGKIKVHQCSIESLQGIFSFSSID
jgi:hypothetical protein